MKLEAMEADPLRTEEVEGANTPVSEPHRQLYGKAGLTHRAVSVNVQ